ncbi:MAG: hypothetical protein QM728_04485 [Gordonia sp. (in: high G+C Gram-positive bacteria)]|uniref:hypothetical protein n=1 Tax=Gordonia sp. (in: high G+C Gram-positive bacteria) TaxID=84139 RepID=UPI0039E41759
MSPDEKRSGWRYRPRHAEPWTWSSWAKRTRQGLWHELEWRLENLLVSAPSIVTFVGGLLVGDWMAG